MAIAQKLNPAFNGKVRDKGERYFRRGAVKIHEGSGAHVKGRVRGTEVYDVKLELHGQTLHAWCTCPFVDQHFIPCKHLWATVLTAERRGLLKGAAQVKRLDLVMDEALAVGLGRRGATSYASFGRSNRRTTGRRGKRGDKAAPEAKQAPQQPQPPPANAWKDQLEQVRQKMTKEVQAPPQGRWPQRRRLLYVLDAADSMVSQRACLLLAAQDRKRAGGWTRPRLQAVPRRVVDQLRDPEDRRLLPILFGVPQDTLNGDPEHVDATPFRFALSPTDVARLLPAAGATGRLRLRPAVQGQEMRRLSWDDGPPWELCVRVDLVGKQYLLSGCLQRNGERLPLSQLALIVPGLVVWGDRAGRFEDRGGFAWIAPFRENDTIPVAATKRDELLQELLRLPNLPALQLPEELRFTEISTEPRPRLILQTPRHAEPGEPLEADLSFDYAGHMADADDPRRGVFDAQARQLFVRDKAREQAAIEELTRLGFRRVTGPGRRPYYQVLARHVAKAVRALTEAGWHLVSEGVLYRRPGGVKLEVKSGMDWFDLVGSIDFGGQNVPLPRLLEALRRGEDTVQLADGTVGMLPEDWLKKYGLLSGLGSTEGEGVRYAKSQVGLLDAFLESQPGAVVDEPFARARAELRAFEGIEPANPPSGFVGELRPYQREGLGWLHFLQKFGFGGCLADDMGLGKTVQVLALLESRRATRGRKRQPPSLVVVPKSLVFNWRQEAGRFTPKVRVVEHAGFGRAKSTDEFKDVDLVITTYGTLRRDVQLFKDFTFDYVILDESQAIKNADTEAARAVRALKGNHRLAMSGTPVENHLGELWSLFEFLNPGMLGHASTFRLAGGAARNPDEETRRLLAQGLRPFILRRTKEQVAKDLPAKTEQTLFCDLDADERKLYDELREHYRRSLLSKVAEVGLKRSKVQVLEALLRLRQASCHPGLIDPARAAEPSAKLDLLLSHVEEVVEEGHKILVFSQFTSLLAIFRDRLDKDGVTYEYLDGKTRDRQKRVERFQEDPDCKLFLISLKAGGVGLNLTAAEYVFLLDPWWNPAVEAQAIDRTHRIGQERPVFAYRLIARDTVEEKVLELQHSKRELADAIINADNSLITNLQREDLELLLS